MDSTAVNYNSKATINTQSWCIPAEEGCMMPQTAYATSGKYSTASATAYQGLAVNYLSSVTIHNKSTCVVYYLGCMSSTALNYESHATVDSGDCWEPKTGCLDTAALNFGCQGPGQANCGYGNESAANGMRLTDHVPGICMYYYPPPPSPPLPNAPPGVTIVEKYKTEVKYTTTDDLRDTTTAVYATFTTNLASRYSVDVDNITVFQEVVTSGRRLEAQRRRLNTEYDTTVEIESASASAANTVTAAVSQDLVNFDAAAAVFGGITTIPTASSVTLTVELRPPLAPPPPPASPPKSDGLSAGAIAGIVVGVLVVIAVVVVVVVMVMKKKSKKSVAPDY